MDTDDFLNGVDQEFLCTICRNVMVNPHTCRKGHQFCFDCITRWLQSSKTCPSDRGELDASSLVENRIAHNLINKLLVRCSNASANTAGEADGCVWSNALSERATHLRDECSFVEVQCGLAGCDFKVRRADVAEHEAICEHREVACVRCQVRFIARDLDKHQLACKGVEIECPRECGKKVLRGDLPTHEEKCEEMVVCCSFADYGCQAREKRRKISEHEQHATAIHLHLAVSTAKRHREESSRLEMALAEKAKQVTEHAEEVLALQTQLKDVQAKNGEQVLALYTHLGNVQTKNGERVLDLQSQLKDSQARNQTQVELLNDCSAKMLALVRTADIGEAPVVWKIDHFTEKLKAKESFKSRTFNVRTKAGWYPMCLEISMHRKPASRKKGFISLELSHCEGEGGSVHFPISLVGTYIDVKPVAGGVAFEALLDEGNIQQPGDTCHIREGFRTDNVVGLTWSNKDSAIDLDKCVLDVTKYLEDDTMTVKAVVRVTPAKEMLV
eukprot:CAMPEP_0181305520 /NCGR_PEP_ID=MMETSP1101-20121128/9778_1 /TAXON_ID=46948 /ORGANISM="Rhodomonas abbreviata, Strain Caron Lab Isolate" /LENGTH=499 /DNA_ID=CAMNT_0023411451 /DNA_START=132 /DNA_END=1631 /DNA_ORIENTATION=-